MFGSEILDIIIGLIFVYLLLSLVCSAINEYIASITNKRGKVLVQGIEALLKDSGVTDAFYAHPLVSTITGDKATLDRYIEREKYVAKKWWPGVRWIYRLYSWFRHKDLRHYRIPSYLPARTFALALVDVAGYNPRRTRDASATALAGTQPGGTPIATVAAAPGTQTGSTATTPATPATPATPPAGTPVGGTPAPANPSTSTDPASGTAAAAGPTPAFRKVLDTLQHDSAFEVSEFPTLEMVARLADDKLPPAVRERMAGMIGQGGAEVQKLHDTVEVWFNNGMDRISGAYKRHTQTMLFVIGLILAIAVNADTLDLWRRLSTDDKLRESLATQAAATFKDVQAANAQLAVPPGADSAAAVADTAQADSADAAANTDSAAAAGAQVTPPASPAGGASQSAQTGTGSTGPRSTILASGLARRDSATQEHAKLLYDSTMAELNATQLRLGWSRDEAAALGVMVRRTPAQRVRVDTVTADGRTRVVTRRLPEWRVEWRPWFWYRTAFWPKLIGLLVTAFALSLGAPFWFDMLNKVVNIRNAGRAPDERSKAPEATGKRAAELPTK